LRIKSLTADVKLFAEAVALGSELIWLHFRGERFVDSKANRPKQTPRLPKGGLRGQLGRRARKVRRIRA
jgi:hypothetical protein